MTAAGIAGAVGRSLAGLSRSCRPISSNAPFNCSTVPISLPASQPINQDLRNSTCT